MRTLLIILALSMAGSLHAAYQPGELRDQRKLTAKVSHVVAKPVEAAAQEAPEVVAQLDDVVRPSDILPLIEREITLMLSRKGR